MRINLHSRLSGYAKYLANFYGKNQIRQNVHPQSSHHQQILSNHNHNHTYTSFPAPNSKQQSYYEEKSNYYYYSIVN